MQKVVRSKLDRKRRLKLTASSNIPLLIMTLPGIIWFLCFAYLPMTGIVMAFKQFKPKLGMYMSPWVGMKNFQFMFRNATFWLTVRNTLLYNSVFMITGVIFPLALAITINEVRSRKLARVFQTTMIMPNFVSYVVVSVIVFAILSADSGVMGHWYKDRGLKPIAFYSEPKF